MLERVPGQGLTEGHYLDPSCNSVGFDRGEIMEQLLRLVLCGNFKGLLFL